MMAKDSVKKRISGESEGMSFTEFTYQLVQGYDFLHLYRMYNCKIQLGGSDQWGNITTGTELIRRAEGGEAWAVTCPLVTKADGSKFGKSESGNIWLDARYTSPYRVYQFWLNVSDADAESYIRIFTFLGREEIEQLIAVHREAPHLRIVQKRLAREITTMIHSEEEYEKAVEASEILFGNATAEALKRLDEDTLLQVFEGVPRYDVPRSLLEQGTDFVGLCTDHAPIFPSKSETRKLVQGGGAALNKDRVSAAEQKITSDDLIAGKYLLVQKGKKSYYMIIAR
jgi:tyrosyl-tRNA synthetase